MTKKLVIFLSMLISMHAVAQIPAYVNPNGLLGWYPFNGNANNACGTGMNGVPLGPTIALTTDRFGSTNSAYHLGGNIDHILIDTAFFNVSWSNYSVSWWLNSDTLDNHYSSYHDQCCFNTIPEEGLVVDMNWGLSNKYSVWADHDPTAFAVWDILGNAQSNTTVTAHRWNHFTLVKEQDTLYHFYVNGSLDTTFKSSVRANNYSCRFNLGNIDSAVSNEGVMGKLDDYGIWNSALSPCDVKRLFHATTHLFTTVQPVNDTFALSGTAHFSITDTGTGNTYQWQVSTGGAFTNLTGTTPYSGVTTPTLTITGVTGTMAGYRYRCVVTGSGGCVDTSGNAALIMSTLGIRNIGNAAISVVPNPTTGDITINNAGQVNVQVYNMMGQLVTQADRTTKVSIANQPAGIYLIKLTRDNDEVVYYERIVKQ